MRWMRLYLISLMSVLISLTLSAQTEPILVTTAQDSSGFSTVTIKNLGSSALTAYAVTTSYNTRSSDGTIAAVHGEGITDAAVGPPTSPIQPGQHGTFRPGGPYPQFKVEAAVWADGTTFGDPVWVHRILYGRQVAARHLDAVLRLLRNALQLNTSVAEIIRQAKNGERQVDAEKESVDEVVTVGRYYRDIQSSMATPPKQPDGSPSTREQTIQQLLARFQRARDRLRPYE
jgi:hypothetical protein